MRYNILIPYIHGPLFASPPLFTNSPVYPPPTLRSELEVHAGLLVSPPLVNNPLPLCSGLEVHGLLVSPQVSSAMKELCTHLHVFKSWTAVGGKEGMYG